MSESSSSSNTSDSSSTRVVDPPVGFIDGDIILLSSDNVDFRVHSALFLIAIPDFRDILATQQPGVLKANPRCVAPFDGEGAYGLPVVLFDDDHHTLNLLLRAIYPVDMPPLTTIADIRAFANILDKYSVKSFKGTVEAALEALVAHEPVDAYILAWRRNLVEVAGAAAMEVLKKPSGHIVPSLSVVDDLKEMSAAKFVCLLQYHQQCRTRAVKAMKSLTWIPGDKIPGSYEQKSFSVTCTCECELKRTGLFSPRMQQRAYIPSWVREYLHQCEVVLAETPHWESVLDARLLAPSILMAADCEKCKLRATELHEFSRKLSRRVQIVIAEVPLPFEDDESYASHF